jgi:hypothetical protein
MKVTHGGMGITQADNDMFVPAAASSMHPPFFSPSKVCSRLTHEVEHIAAAHLLQQTRHKYTPISKNMLFDGSISPCSDCRTICIQSPAPCNWCIYYIASSNLDGMIIWLQTPPHHPPFRLHPTNSIRIRPSMQSKFNQPQSDQGSH